MRASSVPAGRRCPHDKGGGGGRPQSRRVKGQGSGRDAPDRLEQARLVAPQQRPDIPTPRHLPRVVARPGARGGVLVHGAAAVVLARGRLALGGPGGGRGGGGRGAGEVGEAARDAEDVAEGAVGCVEREGERAAQVGVGGRRWERRGRSASWGSSRGAQWRGGHTFDGAVVLDVDGKLLAVGERGKVVVPGEDTQLPWGEVVAVLKPARRGWVSCG